MSVKLKIVIAGVLTILAVGDCRPPKLASNPSHSEPLHEYAQFSVQKIRG